MFDIMTSSQPDTGSERSSHAEVEALRQLFIGAGASQFAPAQAAAVAAWGQPDYLKERRLTVALSATIDDPELTLFDNRANLILLTSQMAMHLSTEFRDKLRAEIRRLLNVEDWDDLSAYISLPSFRTFLRFITFARVSRFPHLGVGTTGRLLALWRAKEKSIEVEFLDRDQCRAVIKTIGSRGQQTLAFAGDVASLKEVSDNNHAGECLS